MNNITRRYIGGLCALTMLVCTSSSLYAQQDPQYTQYMYNLSVVNPAYAGSKEAISLGGLYRNQWTGFDGAPRTFTFFGHSPIGGNVGLGLSLIADEIGPVRETNAYIDVSYTVVLGRETNLSFGLKGGVTFHDINIGPGEIDVIDPNDPFFSTSVSSATPNFGAGAFLHSEKFYVGLSMPNFLESTHLNEDGLLFGSETQHYFVTSGYVFRLSDNVKLKPSFMVKSALSAPVSFDLNANFLLYERLELGASYRYEDSFSGLVNFAITPSLRIGYAYDAVTSDIRSVANSSHEVFILWDIELPGRISRSPRFF